MSKQKLSKPLPQTVRYTKSATTPPKATAPATSLIARPPLWVGLLAAALGFALYINTFGHLYCLDDYSVIKENWVTKGGLKNLWLMFSTEYRYGAWNSPGSLYRPLSLVIFSLQWQLSPDNPMVGHVMNALVYGLTGWLLWVTWWRILVGYPPILPALITLFFIAHPVHTEVVANIKSLDEMLSLLFGTLSLNCIWRYMDRNQTKWLTWGVISYALALFSKESSITYLAIFPLTIWFFTNKSLSQILRISAPFLIPAGLFLLIRHQVLAAQPYAEVYSALDNFIVGAKDSASRLASAFMMCGRYLWVMLVPHPLISDLGYPQMKPVPFSDWRALAGFFLYAGMFVWAITQLGKKHFLAYAILVYLISFSLFSNVLITIGTSYGERVLYTPSLGFAMALAWLLVTLARVKPQEGVPLADQITKPGPQGTVLWAVSIVILLAYSAKTIERNPAWYDSFALYKSDVPNSPNCAKLRYHIGIETTKEGVNEDLGVVKDSSWVKKGIASYTKAIELFPEYHDAYGSRGLAYFRLGQYDSAFVDYKKALKFRPNDDKVLSNLGFIYFLRSQLDSAETVYKKSVALNPRFIDARRNLGAVLAMKKQFPQAIEQWQEGLKYEPDNATLLQYICSAYRDMGQPAQAQPWLDRASAAAAAAKKKTK
ncbi:MAG: tetratricopeptide repeat protein [Saprospiraceae bacterium]|nr:tetratricopeptide repeat protein [Saprospiraceae bacterium]